MKHFVLFLATIFVLLFLFALNRDDNGAVDSKPVVRVFGYSSFTGRWGPGPRLKEIFERNCNCQVEFIEGSDSSVLLQRLKIEGESLGADLVIGFDQFDLQKALSDQSWQRLNFSTLDLEPEIKGLIKNDYFVPYDWGVLAFMGRQGKVEEPGGLDDLLDAKYAHRIALQDPRTSSPGFQFLWWVVRSKGEDAGFQYLAKMMKQAHSFSPSWSLSLGLYNKNQADLVFSYVTSPLYYQIEERKDEHAVFDFRENLPIQIEFLAIPEFCRHCELAEKFVNLMLSPEGQKIIMEKNYMFPVLRGVKEGTPFTAAGRFTRLMKFEIPSDAEVERLLKRWTEIRRGAEAP
ncbi:MAG: thiamine ABC transporter substrate-binding protein [Bdellovibrionaceae bacterium]|nr:thiamine ABC transporter substrate-binding protein [Pseudobdellovibrionaceae bacterium]MBX3032822.1 thiamine ABC transporter substrate-binding protein [Pseudobdellovibrionaceae bacterium]